MDILGPYGLRIAGFAGNVEIGAGFKPAPATLEPYPRSSMRCTVSRLIGKILPALASNKSSNFSIREQDTEW